ncbi:MAG: DUF3108 domain-containing protein [Xanthomonadales bacterium]|nr:DUF3108 domain-containing protein [Xanthomonadales bacterium]
MLTAGSPAGATRSCANRQLAPFEAEYQVLRNGEPIGVAVSRLTRDGDQWTYAMETEANKGLAGLLGGHILELSRFYWVGGEPRAAAYRYEQGIRFKSRNHEAEFDWSRQEVRGEYQKKPYTLPLSPGQSDRMLVNLKLIHGLLHGQQQLVFDSVEKGRVERLTFQRNGQHEMDTPLGPMQTVVIERQHRNPMRQTRSWHAQALAYLPVRMQQIDRKDDEVIEMALVRVESSPCQS